MAAWAGKAWPSACAWTSDARLWPASIEQNIGTYAKLLDGAKSSVIWGV
jgi:hypothetical protein